jgi:hypothetical protein
MSYGKTSDAMLDHLKKRADGWDEVNDLSDFAIGAKGEARALYNQLTEIADQIKQAE